MDVHVAQHDNPHLSEARFYSSNTPSVGVGMWTEEEHARFLEGVKLFANGPWKRVAAYVGTRNVRQTMTHAQKYRLKAARRLREAQRKQAAARHGVADRNRKDAVQPLPHKLQPPKSGGLGLGAYSKLRLSCGCSPRECPHEDESSKIYMSIADAVEILDAETTTAADDGKADDSSCQGVDELESELKLEGISSEALVPMDAAASDSDEFPTLEDCVNELLELLF